MHARMLALLHCIVEHWLVVHVSIGGLSSVVNLVKEHMVNDTCKNIRTVADAPYNEAELAKVIRGTSALLISHHSKRVAMS
jgi:hypothetical protein